MSGPDLHVFTLKFLALKKLFFSLFQGQNFDEIFKIFFDPEKVKKTVF